MSNACTRPQPLTNSPNCTGDAVRQSEHDAHSHTDGGGGDADGGMNGYRRGQRFKRIARLLMGESSRLVCARGSGGAGGNAERAAAIPRKLEGPTNKQQPTGPALNTGLLLPPCLLRAPRRHHPQQHPQLQDVCVGRCGPDGGHHAGLLRHHVHAADAAEDRNPKPKRHRCVSGLTLNLRV